MDARETKQQLKKMLPDEIFIAGRIKKIPPTTTPKVDPVEKLIHDLGQKLYQAELEKQELRDGTAIVTVQELFDYGRALDKPWRVHKTPAGLGKMLKRLKVPRISGGRGKGNVDRYVIADVIRAFLNRTIAPTNYKNKKVSPMTTKKKRG